MPGRLLRAAVVVVVLFGSRGSVWGDQAPERLTLELGDPTAMTRWLVAATEQLDQYTGTNQVVRDKIREEMEQKLGGLVGRQVKWRMRVLAVSRDTVTLLPHEESTGERRTRRDFRLAAVEARTAGDRVPTGATPFPLEGAQTWIESLDRGSVVVIQGTISRVVSTPTTRPSPARRNFYVYLKDARVTPR